MNPKSFVEIIAHSLKWHKERCLTFSSLVVSLINQGNVQHHALSLCLGDESLKSKLERIRRFFAEQIVDYESFAHTVVLKAFGTIPKMHLIMDRTNWKFGKKNINYLVLDARVGRVVFPLFWSLLDHQGCSDADQRKGLMEMFRKTFGFDKILSFTADREFIGEDWLSYLVLNRIPFFIRIKDNRVVEWGEKTKKPLKEFFAHLKEGEHRCLYKHISNLQLFVVGKKVKNEYVVICSNVKNSTHVLKTYKTRWNIERCFLNMKNQGFNIEHTHMTLIPRLMKLMLIVALAILLSCLFGLKEKCAFKNTVRTPLYSLFTRGLRFLKRMLWKIHIDLHLPACSSFPKSEG